MKQSRLTTHLIFSFALVSLIPLLLLTTLLLKIFEEQLHNTIIQNLNEVADHKVDQIERYFHERVKDVSLLSHAPYVQQALAEFTDLATHSDVNSLTYQQAKQRYHTYFSHLIEMGDYDNLWLITTKGEIVFTVLAEIEGQFNLFYGPYQKTELANSFENTQRLLSVDFANFAFYPHSEQFAAFIIAPVMEKGRLLGALALQISPEHLYRFIDDSVGLGDTGEIVIVRRDGERAVVIKPNTSSVAHLMQQHMHSTVDLSPPQLALQGQEGYGIKRDYRNQEVIAVWRYLARPRWGMVVKMDTAEAFQVVHQMWIMDVWAIVLVVGFLLSVAWYLGQSLARPLQRLTQGVEAFTNGQLQHRITIERDDELGDLAFAFNQMAYDLQLAQATLEQTVETRTAELRKEIAERKQIAERVKLWAYIFEHAEWGIVLCKMGERYFEYVNPTFARQRGYTVEEMQGMPVADLFPEEQFDTLQTLFAELQHQHYVRLESEHLRKDGSRFPVEIEISVINDMEGKASYRIAYVQDITLRKLAESRLRIFEHMVSTTRDLMAFVDANYIYRMANTAYIKNMGKTSQVELVGHSASTVFDAKTFREDIQPRLERCLAGEEIHYQKWINDACYLDVAYYPFYEKDQTISGIVISARDITELHRAEQNLRDYAERLTLAAETSNIGIWEWNIQQGQIIWDAQMFKIFPCTPEEFQGRYEDWSRHLVPEDLVRVEQLLQSNLQQQEHSFTWSFRIVWPNKTIHHIKACAQIYRDAAKNPVRIIGTNWDITEQQSLWEKLKRSEQRFRALIESSPAGIFETDSQGKCLLVNRRWCEVAGLSEEEAVNEGWLRALHPEDHEVVFTAWERMVHSQEESKTGFDVQCRFINQQRPQITWVVGTVAPILDENGQLTGYIGLNTDITLLKNQEEELLQAKEQAETANRAKSAFLANMSHELRTPLNAILGFAQIVRTAPDLPTPLQKPVEKIYRGGDYLLTLINDILDLSKIEAGRIELYPEIVNIPSFLEDIVDIFQFRAEQKNIVFYYQVASSFPNTVEVDPKRLRQVLLNLLGNAIKFTEQGEVTLKVVYSEGHLQIEITDTGIGIAPEKLEDIFRPFVQTGDSKYKTQGTGLGLSITHKLIELMNGKITVHSKLDEGSCFTVQIPLEAGFDQHAVELLEPVFTDSIEISSYPIGYQRTDNSTAPLRILSVDDIADNREVLCGILQPLGFELASIASGKDCLQQAPKFQPDIILMDMRMPGLSGLETMRALQGLVELKNVPVIVISASVYNEDRVLAFQAGGVAYLNKPIKRSVLLQTLQVNLPLEWQYAKIVSESSNPLANSESLPTEWLHHLEQAVYHGERNIVQTLLKEAAAIIDKTTHTQLQYWIDNYEYEQILDWIMQQLTAKN